MPANQIDDHPRTVGLSLTLTARRAATLEQEKLLARVLRGTCGLAEAGESEREREGLMDGWMEGGREKGRKGERGG